MSGSLNGLISPHTFPRSAVYRLTRTASSVIIQNLMVEKWVSNQRVWSCLTAADSSSSFLNDYLKQVFLIRSQYVVLDPRCSVMKMWPSIPVRLRLRNLQEAAFQVYFCRCVEIVTGYVCVAVASEFTSKFR